MQRSPVVKIVTFNVNGLRARLHQLQELVERHRPDIIGLQETKVQDKDFPLAAVQELGYRVQYHGQKSHYGVALLSRCEPLEVQKGFPDDNEDDQRRLLTASFALVMVASCGSLTDIFPKVKAAATQSSSPQKSAFMRTFSTFYSSALLQQTGWW
jgi:exodeoxyribonuclease III